MLQADHSPIFIVGGVGVREVMRGCEMPGPQCPETDSFNINGKKDYEMRRRKLS
jgi:hypothetical protein